MQRERDLVIFDLETTGVDTQKDRVVQLAFLKVGTGGEKTELVSLVNPEMSIPEEASEVHGITDEDVKDAPTFKQLVKKIIDFISECDIASFNGNKFDIPLLMSEINRAGETFSFDEVHLIDAMSIETQLVPRTLSAVFERRTGKEMLDAHDAMADVKATYEVLKSQFMELQALDEPVGYKELEKFSREGKERADIAGLFHWDDNNELCWGFGKHRGKSVKSDIGYYNWFMAKDFPKESKQFVSKYLNQILL